MVPESDEVRQERARRIEFDWEELKHSVTDKFSGMSTETFTKLYMSAILGIAVLSLVIDAVSKLRKGGSRARGNQTQ